MAGDSVKIEYKSLLAYVTNLYAAAGLETAAAEVCAACTVQTNLWGVDSHGILRTPVYIERLLKKAVNPKPSISYITKEQGPIALCDGDAGMGYVVGTDIMKKTIEKAKNFGIGMIVVRNSNHFGAASLYTRMASDEGLLGIVATNVKPNIGMPGAKASVTGNNPLALSAPLGGPFPFSLDISMSAVSGGKILLAQKKGMKIPMDWAIDREGKPTDDPFVGFAGIMLPTGMHKGLGLSFFIDIITGVISGGPFLQNLKSMYKDSDDPSETTHIMCVIDPSFFMTKELFIERMKQWAEMVKATPMADPNAKQIIPGEIEYHMEIERKEQGISIPVELVEDFIKLEERLKLSQSIKNILIQ